MNRLLLISGLSLVLTLLLTQQSAAAPPQWNLQATHATEDFEGDQSNYQQLTGSIRYVTGLSRHTSFNLNADLGKRFYDWEHSDDPLLTLAEVIFNYVPSRGFRNPMYSIGMRQEFEFYENSQRDLSKTSLIFADTLRLTDRVTFSGGLELVTQSTDLEDITSVGLFANTDWSLSRHWLMYFNLKLQQESITNKSVSASRAALRLTEIAGHHSPSESGGTGGLPAGTDSSEADSDNTFITLGSNYQFNAHHSIDLSYQLIRYALKETTVDGSIFSLDYFYTF